MRSAAIYPFVHHDLGQINEGRIIEVTLVGGLAGVHLLDDYNYTRYASGKSYKSTGGIANRAVLCLQTTKTDFWHITVEACGMRNNVSSSVIALPMIQQSPLASVPDLFNNNNNAEYDVFILCSAESKNSYTLPLASTLAENGLSVSIGEIDAKDSISLCELLNAGLSRAGLGIVIVSCGFIKSDLQKRELCTLLMNSEGKQRLLPLFYRTPMGMVYDYCPKLIDLVSRNSDVNTATDLANEIAMRQKNRKY